METDNRAERPKVRKKGSRTIPVRARILVAAGDLFHKQGIRGVGVEAIAEAAQIALDVVTDFLQGTEAVPREVTFVLFDRLTYEAYSRRFQNRE